MFTPPDPSQSALDVYNRLSSQSVTADKCASKTQRPSFALKLLCWCFDLCPRVAGFVLRSPGAVKAGSWRLGPKVESRIAGEPEISVEALRVNGRSIRFELAVRHYSGGAGEGVESAQVVATAGDTHVRNLTDIVRKRLQVVGNQGGSHKANRGCHRETVGRTVEGTDLPAVAVGPVESVAASPIDQVDAETNGGVSRGGAGVAIGYRGIPPCVTHEPVKKVEAQGEENIAIISPSRSVDAGVGPVGPGHHGGSGGGSGEGSGRLDTRKSVGRAEFDSEVAEEWGGGARRPREHCGMSEVTGLGWEEEGVRGVQRDLENVEAFDGGVEGLDGAGKLDVTELEAFEKVLDGWIGGRKGVAGKVRAVRWLGAMVGRMRARWVGGTGVEVDHGSPGPGRQAELDRIGLELAGERVVARDGGGWVRIEREGGVGSRIEFDQGDGVRIVGADEFPLDGKGLEKVRKRGGKVVAVKRLRFIDPVTGAEEFRTYGLVDDEVQRVYEDDEGKVTSIKPYLSWQEDWAIKLIKVMLDEVSR
jgi:hypothetical protein